MNDSSPRWKLAQSYEKNWWSERENSIDLTYLKHYANELMQEVSGYVEFNSDTSILEIGSGAAGILTFLPSNDKHAIDPLEDYFSSIERYSSFRDKQVQYQTGVGEHLPYQDRYFDFIIIDNVLDHCNSPEDVVKEMYRVLKPGGHVYFRQHTYHLWGKIVRELLELVQVDKGHPHTFLKSYLEQLVRRNGFTIIKKKSRGYYSTWKSELQSPRLIDKLKVLLFATRDKTLYILNKQPNI